MAAVHITSPIVKHAPLLASAQITGLDLRRETCWFVMTVVPFPEDTKEDYHYLEGSYKIFRRFEHFQYFANYITVECNNSNCQVPKLKTRKRLLFSKMLYAERRKEDLNGFLTKIFQLPLKVRSSLCFAEFLGLWKGDLKENGFNETTFSHKIDYLGRELSPEAKKITTAPLISSNKLNQDLSNQRPHIRNHPHKQRCQERKKSYLQQHQYQQQQQQQQLPEQNRPRLESRQNSERMVNSDASVQRAKTCLANSLQSHYTMSTPWNNLRKTPSLKVAPWNIRHLTPKEMLALEDKRQSLARSHTYTLGAKRSMHFVSPFIRAKVIFNSEHIINFLLPRNIQLDELRQRVFAKFNKSGITEYDREEMIVLCYKRDNKVVIVATNEDLRKIIVDNTDKFTFYLPSNNLLEEFFWMREVIEIQESFLKRQGTHHSNKSTVEQNEKPSQRRESHELQRASSRRQTALVSLQKQNTLANFRKNELTTSNRNSVTTKAKTLSGSYRARRVRHSDRQGRRKGKLEKTSPTESPSLPEESDSYQLDNAVTEQKILKIVLDSDNSMNLNLHENILYQDLRQLVIEKFRNLDCSLESLKTSHLTYKTGEVELVHLASQDEMSKLFIALSSVKTLEEKQPSSKQTLYLLPEQLFTSLKKEVLSLSVPVTASEVYHP
ncbi:hypothetical protein K7432_008554 [Basidiobolus ranarum]|uniref:PX domain-containing protein n=1 Tax=Basidiobolus ranarum TaxID=34480 RepID=A0ABR2VZA2_9FUNG